MDKVKTIIEKLDQLDDQWRQYIKQNDESRLDDVQAFRNLIIELLAEVRSLLKNHDPEIKNDLADVIGDQEISNHFIKRVEESLALYRTLESLRVIERQDKQKVKNFIDCALRNYVVRWDKKIKSEFAIYGFANEKEMLSSLRAIDSLSEYYVENTCANRMVVEDFEDESGLSTDICQYYANMLDGFYKDIQRNLIASQVKELNSKIDALMNQSPKNN